MSSETVDRRTSFNSPNSLGCAVLLPQGLPKAARTPKPKQQHIVLLFCMRSEHRAVSVHRYHLNPTTKNIFHRIFFLVILQQVITSLHTLGEFNQIFKNVVACYWGCHWVVFCWFSCWSVVFHCLKLFIILSFIWVWLEMHRSDTDISYQSDAHTKS